MYHRELADTTVQLQCLISKRNEKSCILYEVRIKLNFELSNN